MRKLDLLNLNNNLIQDVTPLAELTTLSHLYLIGNQIVDVSPLANLTQLQKLDLSENPIDPKTCYVVEDLNCP